MQINHCTYSVYDMVEITRCPWCYKDSHCWKNTFSSCSGGEGVSFWEQNWKNTECAELLLCKSAICNNSFLWTCLPVTDEFLLFLFGSILATVWVLHHTQRAISTMLSSVIDFTWSSCHKHKIYMLHFPSPLLLWN